MTVVSEPGHIDKVSLEFHNYNKKPGASPRATRVCQYWQTAMDTESYKPGASVVIEVFELHAEDPTCRKAQVGYQSTCVTGFGYLLSPGKRSL